MAHTLLPYSKSVLTKAKCYITQSSNVKSFVRNLMSKQLVYNEFGDPLRVVKLRETSVPPLGSQDVLVRMLAAPVNPADINTIQGKYPVKVSLPSIPGNEGVGIVEEVGKDVERITCGNKVIVTKPLQGTWRNYGVFNKNVLRVVPDELGVVEAATLTVNPCTAYRMLMDFIDIQDKQVVIQNGANGACGQNVIQLCKAWGVQNINIVRCRPDIDQLKAYLTTLGATLVLTEEELRNTSIFKDKTFQKPKLALNCVGGKNALEIVRHMDHSGKMVTYGGMSRDPVTIPTSAFIFKNISFHGFWMTAWNEKASQVEKDAMVLDIVKLMCENRLKGPVHKMVKLEEYEGALGNALSRQGFTGCKNISLPALPSVGGDEGIGEVVEIGGLVCRVVPGQRVVLSSRLLGSWCNYGIYHERDIHVVSPNLSLPEAAMLTSAPSAAYRLIKDFISVKPGETITQNAANSPCGQCVIQLCKEWGINTFNIVPNRCNYNIIDHLYRIGATTVVTLDEAEQLSSFNTSLTRPVLALNCLGGRYEDVMLKLLERNGTIIYYGDAYCLPLVKQFLRYDVTFTKFHIRDWDSKATPVEKDIMFKEIIQLMVIGKFIAPLHQPLELKNYVYALKGTTAFESDASYSYIFDLTLPP
ncbi:enoyl-[acyl-carrier-protein] reductase, mitochondrial [Amyelois transitella]|uniref:enoyl-[acyl-carrier-protein] reductase, mitochondrial n=1 Tax=Amyelois transitella TaxID=680683 RepID=UPI00067E6450|nr:enoyl-[acyl-carrier-protein] reductase, mitochondrial [Amyelois transitella]